MGERMQPPPPPSIPRRKSAVEHRIEQEVGRPMPEILHDLYDTQGNSVAEISKKLGISDAYRLMRKHGITLRNRVEALKQWHQTDKAKQFRAENSNSPDRKEKHREALKKRAAAMTPEQRRAMTEQTRTAQTMRHELIGVAVANKMGLLGRVVGTEMIDNRLYARIKFPSIPPYDTLTPIQNIGTIYRQVPPEEEGEYISDPREASQKIAESQQYSWRTKK